MRVLRVVGRLVVLGLCVGIRAGADEPGETTPGANTACVDGCTVPLGYIVPSEGSHYEVLSPWAEVDPPALRPIRPRLTDLGGKTIGLFINMKGWVDLVAKYKGVVPTYEGQ